MTNRSQLVWWTISNMIIMEKIQNFSSISLKLCLSGQKIKWTLGVNTTIVCIHYNTDCSIIFPKLQTKQDLKIF